MNDVQKAKITKFVSDTVMSDAVYDVLLKGFLKERPNQDVHSLAASRLAIDFLNQSWKELERYSTEQQKEEKEVGNVGL